jgi:hypothetical protein
VAVTIRRSEQEILALLADLGVRKSTGTLRFYPGSCPQHVISLVFREGKLLLAGAIEPGAGFGDFLAYHGLLPAAQSDAALAAARRQGVAFEAVLERSGLFPAEVLRELAYRYAEELLDAVLTSGGGRFVLGPELPPWVDEDSTPWIDQELYGRLLQRRDVWPQIDRRLREPGVTLRPHAGIEGSAAYRSLAEAERRLFSMLDGEQPVAELLAGRKNRVDLSIVLTRFLQSGLLELVEPERPPATVAAGTAAAEPSWEAPGEEADSVLSADEILGFDDAEDEVASLEEAAREAFERHKRGDAPRAAAAHAGHEPDELVDLPDEAEDLLPQQEQLAGAPSPPARPHLVQVEADETEPWWMAAMAASEDAAAPVPEPEAPPPPPPARQPPEEEDAPVDPGLVPTLVAGVRLEDASTSGLTIDDLFLFSQIDGRSSLRELLFITQLPEKNAQRTLRRLREKGYITLESRGAPVRPPLQRPAPSAVLPRRVAEPLRVEVIPPAPQPEPEPPARQAQARAAAAIPETAPLPPNPAREAPPARGSSPADEAEELHRRAVRDYNDGRAAQAEAALRRALELKPDHAVLRARLAIVLLDGTGRDAEAEQQAEQAVDDEPLMGQCFEALGLVKLKVGDLSDAKRFLEKAQLLDRRHVPSSVAALQTLKSYKPAKGEAPGAMWSAVRRSVRLVT